MFGKNKTVKVQKSENYDGTLKIREVFHTIQGEGPFSGQRSVFLRFAGCNLKCFWCDTDFDSVSLTKTIKETLDIFRDEPKGSLIVITGGEPLLQCGLVDVIEGLLSFGFHIQIETSGSVATEKFLQFLEKTEGERYVTDRLHIVCSPKTPKLEERLLPFILCYKYVLRAGEVDLDGLPNKSTQVLGKSAVLYRPKEPGVPIYVSPCDEHDPVLNEQNLQVAIESVMEHGHLLSLQVHKIINMP